MNKEVFFLIKVTKKEYFFINLCYNMNYFSFLYCNFQYQSIKMIEINYEICDNKLQQ